MANSETSKIINKTNKNKNKKNFGHNLSPTVKASKPPEFKQLAASKKWVANSRMKLNPSTKKSTTSTLKYKKS